MYKDLKTQNPDINVHITYSKDEKTSKITLRGYAVKTSSGVRVDGAKTLVRTASCPEYIPTAEQHLLAAVMAALPKISSERASTIKVDRQLDDDNIIVRAFQKLKSSSDPITPNWGESTRRHHMIYFERNILGDIQAYATEEFLPEDLELLRHKLIDKVLGSGKSKGAVRNAESTIQANFAAASTIYERMRELDPGLPDISFGNSSNIKKVLPEQIKAIPEYFRQKFYVLLHEKLSENPEMVHATVLMVDGGLRTAEAAAVRPQDIVTYIDGHAIVPVLWQADEKKQRNSILKSDSAYRLVPLSIWGTIMLQQCAELIELDDAKATMVAPNQLSAWILSQMRTCGLQEHLDMARAAQKDGPEGRQANYDLAAYVWRRDRVDRWRNICGLTCDPYGDSEIDYLLGHKTPARRKRVDYRSMENLTNIVRKLERYVYDVKISGNPQFSPVQVTHGMDLELVSFHKVHIQNNSEEDLSIRLDIISLENSEYIVVKCPKGQKINSTIRLIETQGKREDRPIIGFVDEGGE